MGNTGLSFMSLGDCGAIYFIESPDGKFIKIGFSRKPISRFENLGQKLPGLRMIGWIPGDVMDEKRLHAICKSERDQGEWFHNSVVLRATMATLPIKPLNEFPKRVKRILHAVSLELATLNREELCARILATEERLAMGFADGLTKTKTGAALTADDIRDLFGAVRAGGNLRDLAIFTVALHRGLRTSEVALLRAQDLTVSLKTIYVYRLKSGESGTYTLHQEEVTALRLWMELRGWEPGPLFLSRNHRAIGKDRLDELIKEYGAVAGIAQQKCHFQNIRLACGLTLRDAGERIENIQHHLGIRDISNMRRYAVRQKG